MQHRLSILPLALIAAVVSLGAAPPEQKAPQAPAETGKPKAAAKDPYRERFRQLDKNGDGFVTKDEWPLAPESFAVVDRDKDGRLSAAELLTPNRPLPPEQRFQWLDANGDGLLSPSELRRGGESLDGRDRTKPGYITLREYADYARASQDVWNPRASLQDRFTFQTLDRNSDGRVSTSEWRGSLLNFNRLDTNRDGTLSPNEWP